MRNLRGDNLLLAIVLVLLVLVIGAYAAFFGANPGDQGRNLYEIGSDRGNGLKVFSAWLRDQGYQPVDVTDVTQDLDGLSTLLIFPGQRAYDNGEIRALMEWVERNDGVLLLSLSRSALLDITATDSPDTAIGGREAGLLKEIGVQRAAANNTQPLDLSQPVFTDRLRTSDGLRASANISSDAAEAVTLAGSAAGAQIIAVRRSNGMILVSTAPELFANSTLRDRDKGNVAIRVVNGMLSNLRAGERIGIDQSRLTPERREMLDDPSSDGALLRKIYTTPWGWAILSALAICMAALALNGRRFGRATPLARELVRRSPAEYIQSMSGLYRRANKRESMLDHYRRQIKRQLGAPYGVSADLDDPQFTEELKKMRADLDDRALLRTLQSLTHAKNASISEGELVKRVTQAQDVIKQQQESWKA
jgi:hypothetical protein